MKWDEIHRWICPVELKGTYAIHKGSHDQFILGFTTPFGTTIIGTTYPTLELAQEAAERHEMGER